MLAIDMKNRYVKTSPIENNGLQDSEAVGEGYGIDIVNEMKKGCNIIFRPPSNS